VSTTYVDPVTPPTEERYQRCESCGAPMDAQQRYCVNCAARRPDVDNPAARYLAAVSRRAPRAPATGSNRSVRGAAVVLLLLLPFAVGVGVVVGRGNQSSDGNSAALLQALHKAGTGLAATSAAGSGNSALASSSSGPLQSDFSLSKGYTVELQTLPSNSTDQAAADQAKKSAEAKGAKSVGIISPSDFTTAPDLGSQNYVLYSGEYKQKGQADAALKKLKSKFPQAQVLKVTAAGGGATNSGSSASGANAGGQVVAQSSVGVVHQVAGIKPTKQDQQQGAQIAQQQANSTGQSYIKSQQGLPDVIAVGGSAGSAPPPPPGQP
jgi:hypothetical protein